LLDLALVSTVGFAAASAKTANGKVFSRGHS
jgi:hypothetical protein